MQHAGNEQGPLLLVGYPGSGKTRELARRITGLVENGIPSSEIMFLTFTNEAVDNMRDRLAQEGGETYLPLDARPRGIHTMHALCHKVICENVALAGLKDDPAVISGERGETRKLLIGDAAQLVGLRRSAAKQVQDCRKLGFCRQADDDQCGVCRKYREILTACNAVDHDEQIMLACRVLKNDEHIRRAYREGARHLLVDEYQDINEGQRQLIRLLSEGLEKGLIAAGDDDQSIYRFRGGSPTYIREFREQFHPPATREFLTECHRCPAQILAGALAMVKTFNPHRLPKPQPQPRGDCAKTDTKIRIWSAPSDSTEAQRVAEIAHTSLPSRGVLILFPRWSFAEDVRASLRRRRIPHSGRPSPFETGLWQLGSMMSSLTDQADNIAFREFLQALLDGGGLIPGPKARSQDSVEQRERGMGAVAALWQSVLNEGMTLAESLDHAQDSSHPLADLKSRANELRSTAEKGPAELLEAFARHLRPWAKLDSMRAEVQLWLEEARAPAGSGVRLMTMHGAKGIQDDVVVILGMEKGVFPPQRASQEEVAEASRLLYVSMTRARRELHILHARKRSGGKTFLKDSWQLERSGFLDAIPKQYVQEEYIPAKGRHKKQKKESPQGPPANRSRSPGAGQTRPFHLV